MHHRAAARKSVCESRPALASDASLLHSRLLVHLYAPVYGAQKHHRREGASCGRRDAKEEQAKFAGRVGCLRSTCPAEYAEEQRCSVLEIDLRQLEVRRGTRYRGRVCASLSSLSETAQHATGTPFSIYRTSKITCCGPRGRLQSASANLHREQLIVVEGCQRIVKRLLSLHPVRLCEVVKASADGTERRESRTTPSDSPSSSSVTGLPPYVAALPESASSSLVLSSRASTSPSPIIRLFPAPASSSPAAFLFPCPLSCAASSSRSCTRLFSRASSPSARAARRPSPPRASASAASIAAEPAQKEFFRTEWQHAKPHWPVVGE